MTENLIAPNNAPLAESEATSEILELETNITNKPDHYELKTIEVKNLSGETVQTVQAKDIADLLYSNE
jgi:hypothetical protein